MFISMASHLAHFETEAFATRGVANFFTRILYFDK